LVRIAVVDAPRLLRIVQENFWHNVKRVHPYQRGRTSITGLRL
jgi:hypothetical protein